MNNNFNLDLIVARKLLALRQSATDRGKEFNLTFTSLKNIYRAKRCFYTGKVLNQSNRSIDRVDNEKGYVIGNVVACDRVFNLAKAGLTLKDIEILYNKTKKTRGLK